MEGPRTPTPEGRAEDTANYSWVGRSFDEPVPIQLIGDRPHRSARVWAAT